MSSTVIKVEFKDQSKNFSLAKDKSEFKLAIKTWIEVKSLSMDMVLSEMQVEALTKDENWTKIECPNELKDLVKTWITDKSVAAVMYEAKAWTKDEILDLYKNESDYEAKPLSVSESEVESAVVNGIMSPVKAPLNLSGQAQIGSEPSVLDEALGMHKDMVMDLFMDSDLFKTKSMTWSEFWTMASDVAEIKTKTLTSIMAMSDDKTGLLDKKMCTATIKIMTKYQSESMALPSALTKTVSTYMIKIVVAALTTNTNLNWMKILIETMSIDMAEASNAVLGMTTDPTMDTNTDQTSSAAGALNFDKVELDDEDEDESKAMPQNMSLDNIMNPDSAWSSTMYMNADMDVVKSSVRHQIAVMNLDLSKVKNRKEFLDMIESMVEHTDLLKVAARIKAQNADEFVTGVGFKAFVPSMFKYKPEVEAGLTDSRKNTIVVMSMILSELMSMMMALDSLSFLTETQSESLTEAMYKDAIETTILCLILIPRVIWTQDELKILNAARTSYPTLAKDMIKSTDMYKIKYEDWVAASFKGKYEIMMKILAEAESAHQALFMGMLRIQTRMVVTNKAIDENMLSSMILTKSLRVVKSTRQDRAKFSAAIALMYKAQLLTKGTDTDKFTVRVVTSDQLKGWKVASNPILNAAAVDFPNKDLVMLVAFTQARVSPKDGAGVVNWFQVAYLYEGLLYNRIMDYAVGSITNNAKRPNQTEGEILKVDVIKGTILFSAVATLVSQIGGMGQFSASNVSRNGTKFESYSRNLSMGKTGSAAVVQVVNSIADQPRAVAVEDFKSVCTFPKLIRVVVEFGPNYKADDTHPAPSTIKTIDQFPVSSEYKFTSMDNTVFKFLSWDVSENHATGKAEAVAASWTLASDAVMDESSNKASTKTKASTGSTSVDEFSFDL